MVFNGSNFNHGVNMRMKIFLHNLSHALLPFFIAIFIAKLSKNLDPLFLVLAAFSGAFSPDIDHLKIFFDYKFKSFAHFFVYSLNTDRYRKSILIFHNLPFLIILLIVLPLFFVFNIYLGIYFLSFLSHLILDFAYDFLSIKKTMHWKITRRI